MPLEGEPQGALVAFSQTISVKRAETSSQAAAELLHMYNSCSTSHVATGSKAADCPDLMRCTCMSPLSTVSQCACMSLIHRRVQSTSQVLMQLGDRHSTSAHQITTISLNLTFSGLHLLCRWMSGKTKHARPSMHTTITMAAKLTATPKLLFCSTTPMLSL